MIIALPVQRMLASTPRSDEAKSPVAASLHDTFGQWGEQFASRQTIVLPCSPRQTSTLVIGEEIASHTPWVSVADVSPDGMLVHVHAGGIWQTFDGKSLNAKHRIHLLIKLQATSRFDECIIHADVGQPAVEGGDFALTPIASQFERNSLKVSTVPDMLIFTFSALVQRRTLKTALLV